MPSPSEAAKRWRRSTKGARSFGVMRSLYHAGRNLLTRRPPPLILKVMAESDLRLRARTSWKAFAGVYLLAAVVALVIWYAGLKLNLGVPGWIVGAIGLLV